MSYSVKYEDIGLKDFKEVWDYQTKIFNRMVEEKKSAFQSSEKVSLVSPGTLIFVEHPHVYTLGKNGSENNLLLNYIQLQAKNASFYRIDRGGDITYHGPGQIVGYPIFDIEAIGTNLKGYIHGLEEAVIRTLAFFGIKGERLEGATGVWLDSSMREKSRKICAIGVRASRYISMHGFAFNVNTQLEYFNYINPCGFTDRGVTSLEKELGKKQDMEEIKKYLRKSLAEVFDLQFIN
ncbi:MAG TPA: lipoyl(octanoyl) transferase LipB [Bacteroidales bacterium]|nr:lipoyl(octanoyl) transferase LipB [Bacteroidales bacterium]HQK70568.1 lipoyl(octanoyl) transferase LipB [Bacteroidales bacterium]HRR16441.1 lipoyl(octanoyl) transferase LipB [Bacteroidales bacterium]HRT48814.1 lipoyl(octanoyl) transferase LipB [Bacteroidales bacterium]HRU56533.1 lipoyl(octanoyl) transferase LipB [Bacteroidales bacterium]